MNNWRKGPGLRPGPEYELVFSKTIRLRNGRVLFAAHYGLNAFAFWVKTRSA